MSVRIAVDARGLEEAARRAPAALTAGLERVVTGATIDAEGAVLRATPVGATGHLRQSVTHEFSGAGLGFAGRVFSGDVPVKVVAVEEGRAPGRMPPAAPIELWVARKLGLGGKELKSATFLIRRAIGRRGTKPAGMFAKGADAARAAVAGRMAALRAEIGRLL